MQIFHQLVRERKWREAEERILELRKRAQFDPQVLFGLGYVLQAQGRSAEAITALRRCLSVSANFVPAMVQLSALLLQTREFPQAIALAETAARCQPNDAGVHGHLATCWERVENFDKAVVALERALQLRPDEVDFLVRRLMCLITLFRKEEAVVAAERVLAIPSQYHSVLALTTLIHHAAERSAWDELAPLTTRLEEAVQQPSANCNPSMLMLSLDDPAAVLRASHLQETIAPPTFDREALRQRVDDRLVIGYYTADVRSHPVAQMLLSVVARHDRSRFRLVLLRLLPDDGSAIARQVAQHFDHEVELFRLADAEAVAAIRAAGIDVLVDLNGITSGYRLNPLAPRPCPVQLLWLGCPLSTGRGMFDAFLVDDEVCPPGYERFCSEPLYRLPLCYHPISTGECDGVSTLDRRQCGLPDDALVVGIFVAANRVRPPFIEQVARCLAPHPQAHLWVRAKAEFQPRVRELLAGWGLPAERVHFLPWFPTRADYLRAQQLVDLMVDSHPYGGHSTTGEALSLGVPVLCRRGRSIYTRVGASMMRSLGLADLVADSDAAQMAQLTRWLTSPEERSRWRSRFAAAAAPPAEQRHVALTRALEQAYRTLFRRAAGLDDAAAPGVGPG